ncbi:amino acid racemase [Clostridium sp. HMP27]|uniref:aspartate/glutamate racemase family protein n=1 Tax=Clostridium sp. HMP27 TaxID=1487921 RepID=UPI00052D85F0|nr:amino acid racemase [Clostridium sp. HMP27]KGK85429.1 aspartate racemase [Clostridium sp. HMP27]
MSKVVGILGGMGPQATCDLFGKIISYTNAKNDQENIHLLIDNNVEIPDRTSYILGKGENPIAYMIETAVKLKNAGADMIIMPCNTAHYFYDKLTQAVEVPFINMIEEVGKYIYESYGKCKVGLLATTGTYKGKVYETYCDKYNLEITSPNDEEKNFILDLIYKVKAGDMNFEVDKIIEILNKLKNNGINTIILGCTELPLVFDSLDKSQFKDFNFISSTDILAKRTVELAKDK